MTRYRKLKKPPVVVRTGSVCGVFAGMCALIMMSCALAGLAMSTRGADFMSVDLVDHEGLGVYEWRVQDRDVDPDTTSTWTARKAVVTDGGGLSFDLNTLSTPEVDSDLYTVYMVRYGNLDLSAALTITVHIKMTYTGDLPTLVCRNLASPYTAWLDADGKYYTPHVKIHFLGTTGSSWDCSSYWWCNGADEVQFAYLDEFDPTTKTVDWTLTASLTDLGIWSDRAGHLASSHDTLFAEALGGVRMIGLAFGGNGFGANGVAVKAGSTVTFELQSYAVS